MKNSSFSCEGCCRSLGNKTEVNQMKRVKDHIELLHDLLVHLDIYTLQSSIYLVTREPANQHTCDLLPLPSVTFWAKRGHQPASASGCPTAESPPASRSSFGTNDACNTDLHKPTAFAGRSGARGLSMSRISSICHGHLCPRPALVRASQNSPWSTR